MPSEGDILLADDDADFAFLFKTACEEVHLSNPVKVVEDGSEVIRWLSEPTPATDRPRPAQPRLVLLDLKLPRVGGFEVLRWIRDQPRFTNLNVIILTGSEIEGEETRSKELGANDYLIKPFQFHELLALVRHLRDDGFLNERAVA